MAPATNEPVGSPGTGSAAVESSPTPVASTSRGLASRMNWLRAGVLGANNGIISTAGLVVGAVSMSLGEYVSVSSQRDTERSLLADQRADLAAKPGLECARLAEVYQAKRMSPLTAWTVAKELTIHDAFAAHIDAELGIDPDALTNPWHAAAASATAFSLGALFPLVAIALAPQSLLVPVTVAVVVLALVITGTISASLGGANRLVATIRLVLGGALAMAATYGIGQFIDILT